MKHICFESFEVDGRGVEVLEGVRVALKREVKKLAVGEPEVEKVDDRVL